MVSVLALQKERHEFDFCGVVVFFPLVFHCELTRGVNVSVNGGLSVHVTL